LLFPATSNKKNAGGHKVQYKRHVLMELGVSEDVGQQQGCYMEYYVNKQTTDVVRSN
jgi:hypothetical protein